MPLKDPKKQKKRLEYNKQYSYRRYHEDVEYRRKHLQGVITRQQILRVWCQEFKAQQKCAYCGESHPACLDFHHIDSSQKEISVSNAISRGWLKERILKEVSKCIVLCANCHRKMHAAGGPVGRCPAEPHKFGKMSSTLIPATLKQSGENFNRKSRD